MKHLYISTCLLLLTASLWGGMGCQDGTSGAAGQDTDHTPGNTDHTQGDTDGYSDVTENDAYCELNDIECGLTADPEGNRIFCGNCEAGSSCRHGECEAVSDECDLATCDGLDAQCGEWSDGCEGRLFCGACSDGDTCEGGKCVSQADQSPDGTDGESPLECEEISCEELDATCGEWSNGCGGTLSCGTCDGSLVCDGGTCVEPDSISHNRVDNPFDGSRHYLNPEYVAKVEASRQRVSGNLAEKVAMVKTYPTAVWLDTVAAVNGYEGRMGLEGHLNEALRQGKNSSKPVLVAIVVYDLPNRDCAALASNGELQGAAGMERYKNEYIGRIAEVIRGNPAYAKLRIAAVVEPDSLPNLVTNMGGEYPNCIAAEPIYREGIRHAVAALGELSNMYLYLDIAHSGWLGWEHGSKAAQLYKEVLSGGLIDAISGFATNVSNYSTLQETFNPYEPWNEENVDLIENFYEWNAVIDELSFVDSLRQHFPDKGFVVDTSRNGWQPRGDKMPLDARAHRGNWCNQENAGMGERPRANPKPGIHAFFWIKPPGESDGTSSPDEAQDPDNPTTHGKHFDPMCGAEPIQSNGASIATGALPGAPHAGMWFHEQFIMLVENAQPQI